MRIRVWDGESRGEGRVYIHRTGCQTGQVGPLVLPVVSGRAGPTRCAESEAQARQPPARAMPGLGQNIGPWARPTGLGPYGQVYLHRAIKKMPTFTDVKQKNMPIAQCMRVLVLVLASLALAWPMTH